MIGRRRRAADVEQPVRPLRPGPRGWRGRGGGADTLIEAPPVWRGTSVQVCGLWPWIAGSGTPNIGVPFARHLGTGATVCCDPVSWFQRAGLITNPSMFMLGKAGFGKTAAVQRLAVGLAGQGVLPLVLGDTRPDYIPMIRALGGQVISLGRGRGSINVLDPGEAPQAAARLRAAGFTKEADEVLGAAHGVRVNMVHALLTVLHRREPDVREMTIVSRALSWLDEHHDGVPVMEDLLAVVRAAPPELRDAALDRGSDQRYAEVTEDLEAALMGLLPGGRFGEIFSRPTTEPMHRDKPVVVDVSAIPPSEAGLLGAALMAAWSQGFASVAIANTLADVGLEPRRHYVIILDELHRVLTAGTGMVYRLRYLSRLNRTEGVGQIMITHEPKDLQQVGVGDERQQVMDLIKQSGIVVIGPLTRGDLTSDASVRTDIAPLDSVVDLSGAEVDLLTSWVDPPAFGSDHPVTGRTDGQVTVDEHSKGRFLIKVGGRPGIPCKVELTAAELGLHTSNRRWVDG